MPYDQRDPDPTAPKAALAEIYAPSELLPDPLPADPLPLARAWYDRAHADKVQPNPNAMTLGTVSATGMPSARIVLCKNFDASAGLIVFYTNYESRKSEELGTTGRASLVFHWDVLDRQIRMECRAVRSPKAESDAYFASRPIESRLGAWSSNQSREIGSRLDLIRQVEQTAARFGLSHADLLKSDASAEIPRPPHWGGWRLWIERIELWAAGPGRVHDRAVWQRELTPAGEHDFEAGGWSRRRLQP